MDLTKTRRLKEARDERAHPICFHLYKAQEQVSLVPVITGQEEAQRASGMLGDVVYQSEVGCVGS